MLLREEKNVTNEMFHSSQSPLGRGKGKERVIPLRKIEHVSF